MHRIRLFKIITLTFVLGFGLSSSAVAGAFGEVSASLGGLYPQGTFSRYAEPGFAGTVRGTIHIPSIEFMAGWLGFSFVQFSRETIDTRRKLAELDNGVTLWRPVEQTTSETMFALHVGGQLASNSRRSFFRPKAAMGIGLYHFRNTIDWKEEDGDSTVTLASNTLDSQTRFGWRGILGADLFFSPQWGSTVSFVFDHVFRLNHFDGPSEEARRTSRFYGFSVGAIYMFSID